MSWGFGVVYEYAEDSVVESVRPRTGAEGTLLSVGGAHLVGPSPGCAPVSSGLRVCEGGRETSLAGFSLRSVGSVDSIEPSVGGEEGGSVVSVVGSVSSLAEAGLAACAFGAVGGITAARGGADTLECASPARAAGSSSVEASAHGHAHEYTTSGEQFTHLSGSLVESVWPLSGPASGGSMVSVHGSGVGASSALSLGSSRSAASSSSSDGASLSGVSPASSSGAGFVGVGVVTGSGSVSWGFGVVYEYAEDMMFQKSYPHFFSVGSVANVEGSHFSVSLLRQKIDIATVGFVSSAVYRHEVGCSIGQGLSDSGTFVSFPGSLSPLVCLSVASVEDIAPLAVSEAGGTAITIHGRFSGSVEEATCAFGAVSAISAVVVHAGSVIECIAPALALGQAMVRTSANSIDYSSQRIVMSVVAPAGVAGVYPDYGTTVGGRGALVYGNGVGLEANLAARGLDIVLFGNEAGMVVSTDSAGWLRPDLLAAMPDASFSMVPMVRSPGFVLVSLVEDSRKERALFLYRAVPVGTGVQPSLGSARGGLRVALSGQNLWLDGPNWVCAFDDVATPGHLVSSALALCEVPAGATGSASVSIAEAGAGKPMPHRTNASFVYMRDAVIIDVTPSYGPESGGTVVGVSGSTFADAIHHACSFGAVGHIAAARQADSVIECASPAHSDGYTDVRAQNTHIVAPSGAGPTFEFRVDPTPYAVIPEIVNEGAGMREVLLVGTSFAFPLEVAVGQGTAGVLAVVPERAPFLGDEATVRLPVGTVGFAPIHVRTRDKVLVPPHGSLLQVAVVSPPRIDAVQPAIMGARSGGVVTLLGAEIMDHVSRYCYVGARRGMLVRRSSTVATCEAPAAAEIGDYDAEMSVGTEAAPEGTSAPVHYHIEPELWFVRPNHGAAAGGTLVFVAGSDFKEGSSCKFGSVVVAGAAVPASSRAQCASPAGAPAQTVWVSIGSNGHDYYTDASHAGAFVYVPNPEVASIDEPVGAAGGAPLVVRGSNIFHTEHVRVRVGLVDLTVATAGDGFVKLLTPPPRFPGFVPVEVTVDQGNFTSQGVQYLYTDAPIVHMFQPERGPALGGTNMMVYGESFALGGSASCQLGSRATSAVFWSTIVMTCVDVPSAPALGEVEVVVSTGGDHMASVPNTNVQWEYLAEITLNSMRPSVGPETGGVIVNLYGQNFGEPAFGLMCRFKTVYVAGFLATGSSDESSHATCVSPSMGEGDVEVAASNNLKDFSSDSNPTFSV